MILLPQRLFDSPQVSTILRDGNVCILRKSLTENVEQREGYISNHAISMVLAGEQQLRTYEGKMVKVRAGEVLFIPRGVYFVTDLLPKQGNFESILFYFDDELIRTFLTNTTVQEVSREQLPEYLKFPTTPPLQSFVEATLQIYEQHRLTAKGVLELKILELLLLLNHQCGQQIFANFLFRLTLPKKRNIKSFMRDNYDKPLKVEDYAYLTGRSMSTFRRDFKAYFETTPQQWLKDQRLEKALLLMNKQEMSVTEVAYEVGYENISYFIRAFKDKVGMSPKQFMLSLHRNKTKH
ncbi:helix-turn-helix domain-containing protein [Lewinella sp. LCG006]|uniref:helix-turn-helix domain-containing protein n=1 Tax=Lewinella sp. LCG006 TaxID=3231911 RepID=UPI003460F497